MFFFPDRHPGLEFVDDETAGVKGGTAMGGGIGLVAACHFAVAVDTAKGVPSVNTVTTLSNA